MSDLGDRIEAELREFPYDENRRRNQESRPSEDGLRSESILANLDRLAESRERASGASVLKASAFTIAAFDSLPALLAIARAALKATTDEPGYIAHSVEHSHLCAIWVELDDVGTALQPVGTCDCGLTELDLALDALARERRSSRDLQGSPAASPVPEEQP